MCSESPPSITTALLRLLRDGDIVAAALGGALHPQEGRLGLSGGGGCVLSREAGIALADLDYVGFYDKPLLKFERILETYLGVAPRGFPVVPEGGSALDQGEAPPGSGAPRGARRVRGPLALLGTPRIARRERVLSLAVRGSGHPHDGWCR